MSGRPNRDIIPTVRRAMAVMSPGCLQLAIIEMHTRATTFYDRGDHGTGDYFAALMIELAEEGDRRKAAEEYLELELSDLAGGYLDGDQMS